MLEQISIHLSSFKKMYLLTYLIWFFCKMISSYWVFVFVFVLFFGGVGGVAPLGELEDSRITLLNIETTSVGNNHRN